MIRKQYIENRSSSPHLFTFEFSAQIFTEAKYWRLRLFNGSLVGGFLNKSVHSIRHKTKIETEREKNKQNKALIAYYRLSAKLCDYLPYGWRSPHLTRRHSGTCTHKHSNKITNFQHPMQLFTKSNECNVYYSVLRIVVGKTMP